MCKKDNTNHIKSILWYAYQFVMIILCIIFIVIFLGAKAQIIITELNNLTTLLLVVIGFLFAFAGINIYSIFNTNIDEEKDRLKKLQNEYSDQLLFTKEQLDYSKELIKYYQTCQMIIDSKEFNAQIYDWVFSCSRQVDEFSIYLGRLFKEKHEKQYVSFKRDLLDITRGMCIQFNSFRNQTLCETSFFKKITPSDQNNFIEQFDIFLRKINKFQLGLQKTDFPQVDIASDSNEHWEMKGTGYCRFSLFKKRNQK